MSFGSGASMRNVPITRDGYHLLLKELAHLRSVIRPAVLEELCEARAFGLKADNHQYLLARERHLILEKRINDLEGKLCSCEVFAGRKFYHTQVGFGTTVLLRNVETGENFEYQLVGPYESDIQNGKLSIESPLGISLMGRFEGEEITLETPAGIRIYLILSIKI
jgi:transcription elongation factor GreA